MWQGVEMEDFISGPRELLLKLVEDNYPLPLKPDSFQQGLHRTNFVDGARMLNINYFKSWSPISSLGLQFLLLFFINVYSCR
jgi:hypothetical protein